MEYKEEMQLIEHKARMAKKIVLRSNSNYQKSKEDEGEEEEEEGVKERCGGFIVASK